MTHQSIVSTTAFSPFRCCYRSLEGLAGHLERDGSASSTDIRQGSEHEPDTPTEAGGNNNKRRRLEDPGEAVHYHLVGLLPACGNEHGFAKGKGTYLQCMVHSYGSTIECRTSIVVAEIEIVLMLPYRC